MFDALGPAIADLHFVYATTARPRGMIKTVITPEMAGADMRARIGRGQRLGILFGRERWGLDNDEVALADVIVSAPVNPAFASLNIAQAVLLVGYEWYKVEAASIGQGTAELPAIAAPGLRAPDTRSATKDELDGFFRHLEEELDQAGFYKTRREEARHGPQHAQPVPARRAHRAGGALAARHGGEPEPRPFATEAGELTVGWRILVFDSGMGGLTVAAGNPGASCRRPSSSMPPTAPPSPMAPGARRRWWRGSRRWWRG